MANAKKCDRCGNFYDKYDGVPIRKNAGNEKYRTLTISGPSMCMDFDMCPECMKGLYSFLKKEENE